MEFTNNKLSVNVLIYDKYNIHFINYVYLVFKDIFNVIITLA